MIRMKMPKLLAKTMQRRNHKCNDTNGAIESKKKKKKKIWAKPVNLLPKKVGFMVCSAFGHKKSPETSSASGGEDGIDSDIGDALRECLEEREAQILAEADDDDEPDDSGSVENRKGSINADSLKPFSVLAPTEESAVSGFPSLKEILEITEDGKGKQKEMEIRLDDKRHSKQTEVQEGKAQPLKGPSSFSADIFSKTNGLSFNNLKVQTNKTSTCDGTGKQVSSSNLTTRVPSRKIWRSRSTRKKVITKRAVEEENGDQKEKRREEEEEEEEPCKKRILMGERCRPLNLSGALLYDKIGVLLPDDQL